MACAPRAEEAQRVVARLMGRPWSIQVDCFAVTTTRDVHEVREHKTRRYTLCYRKFLQQTST